VWRSICSAFESFSAFIRSKLSAFGRHGWSALRPQHVVGLASAMTGIIFCRKDPDIFTR
jgi:hypothetical protein